MIACCIELLFKLLCVSQALVFLKVECSFLVELSIGGLLGCCVLVLKSFRYHQILCRGIRDAAFLSKSKTLFLACLAGTTKNTCNDLNTPKTMRYE